MCHPKVFPDRSATALQGKFRSGFTGIFMHRRGLPLLFSYLLAASLIAGCNNGGGAGQSVTVQPPGNQAPVANADSATTQQDVAVIIDVLANDTDGDVGDTLTVSAVTQPVNGSVVNNATNVTYTPKTGFSGGDTFSYTATDGTAVSNSAAVAVTVTALPPVTFIGAGDIASENWSVSARHELTAQLIEQAIATDPNTIVWTAGDNAYSSGTPTEFSSKYDPSWGRVRYRTYPVAGNHDWNTTNAQGYLDYFCPNASDCRFPGNVQRYWYSYDVGNNWHVIAIDSEYDTLDPGQEQYEWVKQDLQANPRGCIIAYWHHPRFASSSNHPSDTRSANLWALLQSHGADLVLNGHNHHYERFAKQDSAGSADPNGMIQITAGTGGAGLYSFTAPIANSVVRIGDYGVLKLTLRDTDYDWQFINLTGQVLDSGTETCD
jgi:predicted small secreted protein